MKGEKEMDIFCFFMEEVLPTLLVIMTGVLLIIMIGFFISFIWKWISIVLGRKEVKVSYGIIIDKSIEENVVINNMLVGNSIIPTSSFSKEYILGIEFKGIKFKVEDAYFYEKAEIGDKVIIRYLESKGSIEDIQLIEIIE